MRKILLSFSALAIVALAACSKNEAPEGYAKGDAIQFIGGTVDGTKVSIPDPSGSVYDFSWAQGDEVSIWYTNDSGATFTTYGVYSTEREGTSSPFNYASGTELAWNGSNSYTFLATYPVIDSANPNNNSAKIGPSGCIAVHGTDRYMTQAVANVPDHITGPRALMRAESTVDAPTANESITQLVSLEFEHEFAYLELRLSGTDDDSGRQISTVKINSYNTTAPTDANKMLRLLPATDQNYYNPWTNFFPSAWNATEFRIQLGTPAPVSEEPQRLWACVLPSSLTTTDLTNIKLVFTIIYTSGAPKVIEKSAAELTAGRVRPINLDSTPPPDVTPHYTLTVQSTQTVAAAIAAAKTAGDITYDYEIKDIIYLPAGTNVVAADQASLRTLMQGGGIYSIELRNITSPSGLFNQAVGITCVKLVFPNALSLGSGVYSSYVNGLEYIDFGTKYPVSQIESGGCWFLAGATTTTLKLGHTGIASSIQGDLVRPWSQSPNIDLYLGAAEITALGGLPVNPPVWQGKTWKSINAY